MNSEFLNKIVQGNCLELLPEIEDNSVNLILTDLPYGTTDCRWDSVIDLDEMWKQFDRITTDRTAIVLTAAQPFTTQLIQSNIKNFRYSWYWVKNIATGFAFARQQPMRKVEEVCVFYRKFPTYNPQGLVEIPEEKRVVRRKKEKDDMVYRGNGDGSLLKDYVQKYTGYPNNVLDQFKSERGYHPTQKPVSLFRYLVRTYSNPGDTVLDITAGSCTTAVASVLENRNFICFEQDEKYVDIGNQRVNEALKEVTHY
jgi:site-specific DNA-methyltransferase (adenine-specific)